MNRRRREIQLAAQLRPVTLPSVTPDEDRLLRALGEALSVVAEWERLVAAPAGPPRPEDGSDLAADDRRIHPYEVSHAAWQAFLAAVSHLGCLRDSLFEWDGPGNVTVRIHTHGQFSLVRGVLENASRGIWLLEPSDGDERVLRRLRLEWAEAAAQAEVREIVGQPGRPRADRFAELSALVPAGIHPAAIRKKQGYASIVEAAGALLPTGSAVHVLIWRTCSGLAHGDVRATVGYTARDIGPEVLPGVPLVKVTGNVPLLAKGALIGIETARLALGMYCRRCAAHRAPPD